ncbi:hypothetical protein EVAR_31032_1 [Eumeta japonica]|uniref:Uncharacterized protein n=1 Tax=Eumeta variegata TaxID=151549 RepID=A0A4C1VG98_EUMVA|nr:hypothetical protein EVAR_31032_1 [Eumeta japonica]
MSHYAWTLNRTHGKSFDFGTRGSGVGHKIESERSRVDPGESQKQFTWPHIEQAASILSTKRNRELDCGGSNTNGLAMAAGMLVQHTEQVGIHPDTSNIFPPDSVMYRVGEFHSFKIRLHSDLLLKAAAVGGTLRALQ